jgi:hypothetical protein
MIGDLEHQPVYEQPDDDRNRDQKGKGKAATGKQGGMHGHIGTLTVRPFI